MVPEQTLLPPPSWSLRTQGDTLGPLVLTGRPWSTPAAGRAPSPAQAMLQGTLELSATTAWSELRLSPRSSQDQEAERTETPPRPHRLNQRWQLLGCSLHVHLIHSSLLIQSCLPKRTQPSSTDPALQHQHPSPIPTPQLTPALAPHKGPSPGSWPRSSRMNHAQMPLQEFQSFCSVVPCGPCRWVPHRLSHLVTMETEPCLCPNPSYLCPPDSAVRCLSPCTFPHHTRYNTHSG